MKKSLIILSFSILAIAFVSFVPLPKTLAVETAAVYTPFGGRILTAITCDAGILLTVGPPRPGIFFFSYAASRLFAWYQIYRPGPWVLGRAYPMFEVCYVPCQNGRCPVGSGLLIDKVGTSMF